MPQAERLSESYMRMMENWFNTQYHLNNSDGNDALAIAYNTANAVQNRAHSIQAEIGRVKQSKKQRKDMMDDDYYEPVLKPEFHNELSISPSGLIYNPSLRQIIGGNQSTDQILPDVQQ